MGSLLPLDPASQWLHLPPGLVGRSVVWHISDGSIARALLRPVVLSAEESAGQFQCALIWASRAAALVVQF